MSGVEAGDHAAAVEVADDLYDFSGLSINDFSLLQKGLMMATTGRLQGASVCALSGVRTELKLYLKIGVAWF